MVLNEFTWLRLGTGKRLVGKLIKFPAFFFLHFTVTPQKQLCSTWLVTTPIRIQCEVPKRNDALTWIWGASCVPQVAFHAARPGRDRGWGWWQDSGHSRCRSSTRSPGAGGAPAGFCGTHRHISSISFSTPNLQVQSDNTQNSHTHMEFHTYTVLLEGCIRRIPPSLLPAFKLGFSPCTNSNQQFFVHYNVIMQHTVAYQKYYHQAMACEQIAGSVTPLSKHSYETFLNRSRILRDTITHARRY